MGVTIQDLPKGTRVVAALRYKEGFFTDDEDGTLTKRAGRVFGRDPESGSWFIALEEGPIVRAELEQIELPPVAWGNSLGVVLFLQGDTHQLSDAEATDLRDQLSVLEAT